MRREAQALWVCLFVFLIYFTSKCVSIKIVALLHFNGIIAF